MYILSKYWLRFWLLSTALTASVVGADPDLNSRIRGLDKINKVCETLLRQSVLSGKVVLPPNNPLDVGVAVGSARGLKPVFHGDPMSTPGQALRQAMAASPSLRDDLIVEALEKIELPMDPSRLAIFCFTQYCGIQFGDHSALGMHLYRVFRLVSTEPVLQKSDRALAKYKELNFQTVKWPILEAQNLMLRWIEINQGDFGIAQLFDWYATIIHEAVHVSNLQLILRWIRANMVLIQRGMQPDEYFLNFVHYDGNVWKVDSAFHILFEEGLAYSATQNVLTLLGKLYPGVESQIPFDKAFFFRVYIHGRNDIPDKLKISSENWFSRAREVRSTMQDTVRRAGIAPGDF